MAGFFYSKRNNFLLVLSAFFLLTLFSCRKNDKTPAEVASLSEDDNSDEELYNFYSPAEDDASWVEELLMRLEEERIAQELADMETSFSEYQLEEEAGEAGDEAGESLEEALESQAGEGRAFTGKNDQMRFFEYKNETLSPQFTDEGLVVIHSADENVMRFFYDSEYRLTKKEEWKIRSASDAKKLKTELFVYSPESRKVINKEIITEAFDELISYNEKSSPLFSKKYAFNDDRKYIVQERKWKYNSENQLLEDLQKEYSYKDSNYNKPEIFTKRYEYSYPYVKSAGDANESNNIIPPDYKFYENDILKMQNIYSAEKGTYISWVYFDENLSVKTYYEEEVRVRDEYYNQGRLFRTKIYKKNPPEAEEEKLIHKGGEE
jgi:hypothetical protein